ncbi:MAG: ParB/RepB/Spo0J family partition protein [Acidobacteriota bacterium]
MAKLRGLPDTKRMRHDEHYVDHLTSRPERTIGRQIPLDLVDPGPNQPRREFSGIQELVASIQEKGILEPILVRPKGDRFEIIAGERRYRAACKAGLTRIPCIEVEADERGCLEISLVENIQRRDLTAFEEADALLQLQQRFHFTHEEIARKLGRSRTSITESLSLSTVPASIRRLARRANILSRSILLEISRLPDETAMEQMVETIVKEQLSRDDLRKLLRPGERKPSGRGASSRPAGGGASTSGYTFRFKTADRPYSLTLRFAERETVDRKELIQALQDILDELRSEIESGS